MKTLQICAAAAMAAALSFSLAGCSAGNDGVASTPASSSSSSVASSSSATVSDGTPLFEFLADQNPGFAQFTEGFDPEEVVAIIYSRDEYDDKYFEDKDLIKEMFDALAQMVVSGPYTDDIMVTDSGERITFVMGNNDEYSIHFDFGNLVVGKDYYVVDNTKAFTTAKIDIDLYSEGVDIS